MGDDFDGADVGSYLGMDQLDGVFIFNDGEDWARICLQAIDRQTPSDGPVTYVASLDAAAMAAGFELEGEIRIRFQRYGDRIPINDNGRSFDNVTILQDQLGEFAMGNAEEIVNGGSTIELTVARLENLSLEASVSYEVMPLTATPGDDNTTAAGTLVFLPGEELKKINIPTGDDSLPEHTETLRFVLKKPLNGTRLGKQFQTLVQIVDNDWDSPTVSHFAKAGSAQIPGALSGNTGPPPIPLVVSGVTGSVTSVRVNLSDLDHERAGDLDIFLEHPGGQIWKLICGYGDFNTAANLPLDHANIQLSEAGPFLASNTDRHRSNSR